jgi:hypothetical protein
MKNEEIIAGWPMVMLDELVSKAQPPLTAEGIRWRENTRVSWVAGEWPCWTSSSRKRNRTSRQRESDGDEKRGDHRWLAKGDAGRARLESATAIDGGRNPISMKNEGIMGGWQMAMLDELVSKAQPPLTAEGIRW